MTSHRAPVVIRRARTSEAETVVNLFDHALLAVDRKSVREAVRQGKSLVAILHDRIVGGLVRVDSMIQAIAVRPRHRHRGIGSALVNHAAVSTLPLTAIWEADVDPFYRSLGFSRYPLGSGEIFGIKRTASIDRFDE